MTTLVLSPFKTFQIKDKVIKFFKSEAGGLFVYFGGSYLCFSSLSGAAMVSFLFSLGFGAMPIGMILWGLSAYFFIKCWKYLFS